MGGRGAEDDTFLNMPGFTPGPQRQIHYSGAEEYSGGYNLASGTTPPPSGATPTRPFSEEVHPLACSDFNDEKNLLASPGAHAAMRKFRLLRLKMYQMDI